MVRGIIPKKLDSEKMSNMTIRGPSNEKKSEKYDFRAIYLENIPHFPLSATDIIKVYVVESWYTAFRKNLLIRIYLN